MRLVRRKASPEGAELLVGVVPPPTAPRTGDSVAERDAQFLEIWRVVYPRALERALRHLEHDDAYDAAADTMEAVLVRWESLTPGQRTDAWILGVLQNCIRTRKRENRRAELRHVDVEEAEAELERLAAAAHGEEERRATTAALVDSALDTLPPRQREVLLLIKEQGLSYEETAAVLGLRIGTVNYHYYQATKNLRATFARAGLLLEPTKPAARLNAPKGDTN